MPIRRLLVDTDLVTGSTVALPAAPARHLATVLRGRPGDAVVVFDGHGGEHEATVASVRGSRVEVHLDRFDPVERESPLRVRLVQGISRGERMDWAIQKAVELGVDEIVPVTTARSVVRLGGARAERRTAHWRSIVVGACEQCGRTRIPAVAAPTALAQWLDATTLSPLPLLLDAGAEATFPEGDGRPDSLDLLVGPEGGLTPAEREGARARGFRSMRLGPRILRTETAATAALAVLQSHWGDLAL